VSRW